jgi:hypothetical protein
MGILDDAGRKLRAKGQKIKGGLQQQSGEGVKGGITKAKGNINDAIADFNINTKKQRNDLDDDDDLL